MFHSKFPLIAACVALSITASAQTSRAQSPREILMSAAFNTPAKPAALAKVGAAIQASSAILAQSPGDREAKLQHGIAVGYRGQLKRGLPDVQAARRTFDALAVSYPRDAEIQMALAGWHLGAIIEIGPLMARTLGARRASGLQALDRSVALGGGRAFFPAYASMLRIRLNPKDIAGAQKLAEAAVKASAPTPVDRLTQKQAASLLTSLRAGNGKASAALAKKMMPFGKFS